MNKDFSDISNFYKDVVQEIGLPIWLKGSFSQLKTESIPIVCQTKGLPPPKQLNHPLGHMVLTLTLQLRFCNFMNIFMAMHLWDRLVFEPQGHFLAVALLHDPKTKSEKFTIQFVHCRWLIS